MHIDGEVTARIAKAGLPFDRLHGNVWDRSTIRLDTKLKVDKAVVLTILLYVCEHTRPGQCTSAMPKD